MIKYKINLYDRFGGAPSVALRYLETVRTLGVEDDGHGLDVFFSNENERHVGQLIQANKFAHEERFIGLCPAARHTNKMWPAERFADVGRALGKTYGHPVVVFGSAHERERCNAIAADIAHSGVRVLNLAGQISLSETAAALDRCAIVITNDSGLMHIAAARKRNVVAIFGPTVKELGFFPFGTHSIVVEHKELACRPCTHIGLPACPKKHFRCMMDITVQQVIEAAARLMSQEWR